MTRVCPTHACDLMDEGPLAGACPNGCHFPDEWDVFDGARLVAECRGDWRVTWMDGSLDGLTSRRIAGREEDGTGGRAWTLDAAVERVDKFSRMEAARIRKRRFRLRAREVQRW